MKRMLCTRRCNSCVRFAFRRTINGNSRCARKLSSQRQNAELEKEVIDFMRSVCEPVTGRVLPDLGMLHEVKVRGGDVSVSINCHVPGYPYEQQLRERLTHHFNSQTWAQNISINIDDLRNASGTPITSDDTLTGLSRVKHVIGVSSCKGGVGKSTVAVRLALSMAKKGLDVGLLDADVYGPSLPQMLEALDRTVLKSREKEKHILPLICKDQKKLKMLSFGHVNPNSGAPGAGGGVAAVVRGPIASRIINQLLLATDWGYLDYLIVDMPPGTGDVQLTLSQSCALSGVVVVTTPHSLSIVDSAKGIAMFEDLKVPTLAVVENMSYFECNHGERYFPFGRGGRENILQGLKALETDHNENAFHRLSACPLHRLPLTDDLSTTFRQASQENSDCVQDIFDQLASDCIAELFKLQVEAFTTPSVTILQQKKLILLRYFTASEAIEYAIPAAELRIRDPISGKVVAGSSSKDFANVAPIKLSLKGHYGVAIHWSDGYFADIFPFDILRRIALELQEQH